MRLFFLNFTSLAAIFYFVLPHYALAEGSSVGTFSSVVTTGPVKQNTTGSANRQTLNVGAIKSSRATSFNSTVSTGSITQTSKGSGIVQSANIGSATNSKVGSFNSTVNTGNIEQISNKSGDLQELDLGSVTNSTVSGSVNTNVAVKGGVRQTGSGSIAIGAVKNANVQNFTNTVDLKGKVTGNNIKIGSVVGQSKYGNDGRYSGEEQFGDTGASNGLKLPSFHTTVGNGGTNGTSLALTGQGTTNAGREGYSGVEINQAIPKKDSVILSPSYIDKSYNQLIYGNYTEDVTALGVGMQIGTGLLGVDLPGDIRDITFDITHWEWSWGHAGQTSLDAIGLLPVIGALKYSDETYTIIKGTNKATNAIKKSSDLDLKLVVQKKIHSGEFNSSYVKRKVLEKLMKSGVSEKQANQIREEAIKSGSDIVVVVGKAGAASKSQIGNIPKNMDFKDKSLIDFDYFINKNLKDNRTFETFNTTFGESSQVGIFKPYRPDLREMENNFKKYYSDRMDFETFKKKVLGQYENRLEAWNKFENTYNKNKKYITDNTLPEGSYSFEVVERVKDTIKSKEEIVRKTSSNGTESINKNVYALDNNGALYKQDFVGNMKLWKPVTSDLDIYGVADKSSNLIKITKDGGNPVLGNLLKDNVIEHYDVVSMDTKGKIRKELIKKELIEKGFKDESLVVFHADGSISYGKTAR